MPEWPAKSETKSTTEAIDIVYIIDKSGSMMSVKNDAIGGFNKSIEEQKALPGDARATVVFFDTEVDVRHDRAPLADVKPITDETYRPGGMTALFDAIGITLDNKEFNSKGIVVVITDGEENSSTEHKIENIREIIKEYEKRGWEFHYLGAHVNAFEEGHNYGFRNVAQVAHSGNGILAAYSMSTDSMTNYRRSHDTSDNKTDEGNE